ncbi:helix-turn-helix domain-containing protein [Paenibacillus koleovorans]|uniref:helix-turn-helix domain-containing protein n=1 Tax=Paenibacillus koleovorans TaxID=121608 RepID=UPI001FE50D5E|nr:AraC family transcriptional regulator [Paenibacillus koleovorans]
MIIDWLERFELQDEIVVRTIFSFSYKELSSSYAHSGEQHDFWEFVYVDKGAVEITIGPHCYAMKQGDIVFYKPNEFHSLRTNEVAAPNLFIVSFDCDSPAMRFFENLSFPLDDECRRLLAHLVETGYEVFDPPIDTPRVAQLQRKADVPFGGEQLIRLYTELLLVQMVRKYGAHRLPSGKLSSLPQENKELELVAQAVDLLRQRLAEDVTPEQVCAALSVSKTQLKATFKARTGLTLTEYLNKLRLEEAKVLIREEALSFTEIADRLGYSSIHYFSRQFKKATGMAPSEYARSVQARLSR